MLDDIKKDAAQRMAKSIAAFRNDLKKTQQILENAGGWSCWS